MFMQGLITTVKELDREQQDRYRYTIVAHKNDTQSCTLVVSTERKQTYHRIQSEYIAQVYGIKQISQCVKLNKYFKHFHITCIRKTSHSMVYGG